MKKITFLLSALILITIFIFLGCQPPEITSAKVYMNDHDYDNALEQAKLAVKKYPSNATAYYMLGKIYEKKKEYINMTEAFNKSLEISQQHAEDIKNVKEINWVLTFNAGCNNYKNNNTEEAVENFKIAIAIMPQRINAYQNLAYSYSKLDENEKAVNTLIKASEIEPNNIDLKKSIGISYYQLHQFEKAIETFQELAESTKSDTSQTDTYAMAVKNIAFSYDQLGESENAINAYKSALNIFPKNPDLIYNLGRLYYMQENYEKALENFKKIADANPNDYDATYNTALSFLKAKQDKEAIPYFEKAVEIKPDSYDAWNNLGVAYVRANMPEKGKEAFDKADQLKAEKNQE